MSRSPSPPRRGRLARAALYYWHKLFPRHQPSWSVAASVAVGVFLGVMPTLGIALPITLLAATLLRLPPGPALLASFVAIPPTLFFFFYPLGYFAVGLALVNPGPVGFDFLAQVHDLDLTNAGALVARLWHDARRHVLAFVIGMTIVATVSAAVSFALAYATMEYKRARRAASIARRRRRRPKR